MEKLNDLRFIIGVFFAIVGAFLVLLAFAMDFHSAHEKALNLYAGLAMLVFGAAMLWLKKST